MNYQEHVGQMLKHLVDHNTKENVEACVNPLCHALVGVLAHSIPDHDDMHKTMAVLHEQMQSGACDLHSEVFGSKDEPVEEDKPAEPVPVDAETFLRDHFHPERFHG
mgnify:CR=1 FL=1